MSVIGTKRTCRVALHMSAIGGKADAREFTAKVRTGILHRDVRPWTMEFE
jgi:hypothetical protein